ncbi:MAG TPA: hypothetical protein VJS92_12605 [Candidatus Polarisedimenticolaceae bacterium]|nr:hypothetical protein [Candidatus Polarisedimenticolaceae bacterium]
MKRALTPLAALLAAAAAGQAPAPAPQGKGADLQLLEEVRRIAGQVERLRGEKFARPPVAVRAPAELRQAAAEIRARAGLSRERLEARGRAWADVGLGDSGSPQALEAVLATDLQAIGFDSSGNRVLVDPERLSPDTAAVEGGEPGQLLHLAGVQRDEPVFAHILVHVRQRERRGRDHFAETTDGLLAAAAWAEGEANLVAVRYLFDGLGLADDVVRGRMGPASFLEGALVPPVTLDGADVQSSLLHFVYEDGFSHAAERYLAGGWPALDRAMKAGTTTRDLIHGGDPAAPVAIPAPAPPAGTRLVDEDTLGEQAVVVLVSTLSGKDNLALQAGDGWAGDRLFRFEAGDKPQAATTLWVTRWRSEAEAQDFLYALRRAQVARFAGRAPTAEGGAELWISGEREYRIEHAGTEVRLRVGPFTPPPKPMG